VWERLRREGGVVRTAHGPDPSESDV
jgi:hypothetical protein